ncbi:MAG: S46 family peptidase, partial [Flavobacterium sp.]|nr:S46 family peptidase [Flavobacterium sp.]
DVIFDKKLQRTINVDIRYVLWVIEKFANAKHIVDEMTLVK